jgi:hypothetical protein
MQVALAFLVKEAIENGELDEFLERIRIACTIRERIYDQRKSPLRTNEMKDLGQHWVWMNGPGRGHWSVQGTGALA